MKRKRIFLLAMALMMILTGCSTQGSRQLAEPSYPKAPAFDDYEARMAIREENVLSQSFAESLEAFALESGALVFSQAEGNVQYSPVSLYLALALTTAGAEGQTREQLMNTLRAGALTESALMEECGRLYRLLYRDDGIGRVKTSSSLWLDSVKKLKNDFKKNAEENFYAEIFSMDLQAESTAQAMGEWVMEKTSGKLAPKIRTEADTLMVLLNCLDFEDQWIDAFLPENNVKDDFTREDGSVMTAEYMTVTYNPYACSLGDDFTRVRLSLKNSSMDFILPDEGVSAFELASDPERLAQALTGGEEAYAEVRMKIPKFDFTADVDLAQTLRQMGAEDLFGMEADLTGICGEQLFLTGVKQQSCIDVHEKGVSAAAFTQMMYAGGALMTDGVVEMDLDRPFIYTLRDQAGMILFMGICEMPQRV